MQNLREGILNTDTTCNLNGKWFFLLRGICYTNACERSLSVLLSFSYSLFHFSPFLLPFFTSCCLFLRPNDSVHRSMCVYVFGEKTGKIKFHDGLSMLLLLRTRT